LALQLGRQVGRQACSLARLSDLQIQFLHIHLERRPAVFSSVVRFVHLGDKPLAVFDGNVVHKFLLLLSGDLIQYDFDACRQLSIPALVTR